MLPDRITQLLTAYVDGELTPREQQAVAQLLERSADARELLQRLQDDSRRLRQLQPQSMGCDLADSVLEAIDSRKLQPVISWPVRARPRTGPVWVGWTAAAAVLLVLGFSTLLFLIASGVFGPERTPVVEKEPQLSNKPRVPDRQTTSTNHGQGKERDRAHLANDARPERLPMPAPSPVVEGPKPPPIPPEPPGVLTKDLNPMMEPFEVIARPRLTILALRELDQDSRQKQLNEALQGDNAYRLDLFCTDSTRGFERLRAAFRQRGFDLLIDPVALSRLKLKLKTNYFLFTEELTADELAGLLQKLGRDDRKAAAKTPKDGVFDKVVINPLTPLDHQELSKLLGFEPKRIEPPKAVGPGGMDLRKAISENTAGQIVETLQGQGGARPEAGSKPAMRQALVLPYNPVRPNPSSSREVKQFFDSRKPAARGTIQVLLVLQNS